MTTIRGPGPDNGSNGMARGSTPSTSFVDRALADIRKKLLDLTRRNRLLNYRAGTRSLTVVDELPDEVFKSLYTENETMYFSPLPESEEEDEVNKSDSGEQDLFDRIDQPASTKIKPGKNHDIRVENELPERKENVPLAKKHTDQYLQTKLYATDLERKLRKISGDAQTAIEESGTNILYLAIGFLEWYEDDNTSEKNRAPLILLPVNLERGPRDPQTYTYRYSLTYSGEDITHNLSLGERLKQGFGIALPEFGEETLPEEYFEQVGIAIAKKPRWRVAREITLGMFSFGKLLMYLDLDQANWPKGREISKHAIVRTLLGGERQDDGNPFSEKIDIDADPKYSDLLLVLDADSSQHNAIIAIASGRSVVIKGPPGSGKSQTISNAIAVALALGKRILFVSEKMAALEVVRRNLDQVGLGDFCLELHSHKTQKQKLLKDIRTRLSRSYPQSHSHLDNFNQLRLLRNELKTYVDLINSVYGRCGLTVHEILWRAERAKGKLPTLPDVEVEHPDSITTEVIQEAIKVLDIVAKHWMSLDQNTIAAWSGFSLSRYYHSDQTSFERALKFLQNGLTQCAAVCGAIPSDVSPPGTFTMGALEKISAARAVLDEIPSPLDQIVVRILSPLTPTSSLEVLNKTISWLDETFVENKNSRVSALNADVIIAAITEIVVKADVASKGLSTDSHFQDKCAELKVSIQSLCQLFLGYTKRPAASLGEIRDLLDAARLADLAPKGLIAHVRPQMLSDDVRLTLDTAEKTAWGILQQERQYKDIYFLESLPDTAELKGILRVFQLHEKRLFRFFSGEYRKARRGFLSITRDRKLLGTDSWAEGLQQLLKYLESRHRLENRKLYAETFGSLFDGLNTNWKRLRSVVEWTNDVGRTIKDRDLQRVLLSQNQAAVETLAATYHRFSQAFHVAHEQLLKIVNQLGATSRWMTKLKNSAMPDVVMDWLVNDQTPERAAKLRQVASQLGDSLNKVSDGLSGLEKYGHCNINRIFGADLSNAILQLFQNRVALWLSSLPAATKWAEYSRAVEKANELGQKLFIDQFEQGALNAEHLSTAYEYAVYSTMSRKLILDNPKLRDFSRTDHEEIRQQFVKLDRQVLTVNREIVAHQASKHRKPPAGVFTGSVKSYTEMGLLHHEVSKKKRHIPIRQLVKRAGRSIQVIKPCFMMGPLSVAQYLEPGRLDFDLIIMDEASQMRPEEALGAIARGQQIVIVGDPNQLPPTSFFDRLQDEESSTDDDEVVALSESESILDICLQAYQPEHLLKWHYRSEHESLINFSNREFYEGELILFPSPTGEGSGRGICFHHIQGAVFENRRNRAEADAVARAVLRHAQQHPDLSLGVATFNIPQKDLIEEQIDRLRSAYPVLDNYILHHSGNSYPFFVKNLENVQGDERDVIFISATYGPDKQSGRVMQRFGPINVDGGWRRLNVIVTRAKKRVEVFSSMRSTDILAANKSRGVMALKAYLEYAENGGKFTDPGIVTGRPPDSAFEEAVANVLQQAGYKIVPQVGVAGYFVDIGVENPSNPGDFILGIECDGATYHSALTTKDRDRLRQEILERHGWEIHRIWSTDWFNNRDHEIERLLRRVQSCVRIVAGTAKPMPTPTAASRQPRSLPLTAPSGQSSEVPATPVQRPAPHQTTKQTGLSANQVRRVLMEFYRSKIHPKFPGSTRSILRPEMIEAFLRSRPTTKEEFLEFIPQRYRESTDPAQMVFLPEILEILENIED